MITGIGSRFRVLIHAHTSTHAHTHMLIHTYIHTYIQGFIKDGMIGKKRLASMPDRVSNTIITSDKKVVTRPTVINCYEG